MNNYDTFSIILSFLQPKELSKTLLLSRFHYQSTTRWLSKNGIDNIEEYVCPICCYWKSEQNLDDYEEFFDCPSYISRIRNLCIKSLLPSPNQRHSLLCIDCEYYEWDSDKISFPYRGNRLYYIYNHETEPGDKYSVLYKMNADMNIWEWNEIRLFYY